MIRKLKLTALALLLAAPALKAPATTNLLQAVNVAFDNYVQGQPSGNNNVVNQFFFGSRELIKQVRPRVRLTTAIFWFAPRLSRTLPCS